MSRTIFWIGTIDLKTHRGGGGAYARALYRALQLAAPEAEIVRLEPEGPGGRSRSQHRLRQVTSLLRASVSPRSAKLHFDADRALQKKIQEALQERSPDLIIWMGSSAALYGHLFPAEVPRILLAANLEYELYREQIRSSGRALRFLLERCWDEPGKHERFERSVFSSVQACLAISEEEAELIRARVRPGTQVRALPAVASFSWQERVERKARSREELTASPERPLRLGFLGKFSWWPNQQAVRWFLDEVWPQLSEAEPLELHLYGEGSERWQGVQSGIFGHGFATDLTTAWQEMDVFVNPMQSGAGVNVKVCEALIQGVPVLSTSKGLRGLPAWEDPAIRVADTVSDWLTMLKRDELVELALRSPQEEVRRTFSLERAVETWRVLLDEVESRSPAKLRGSAKSGSL